MGTVPAVTVYPAKGAWASSDAPFVVPTGIVTGIILDPAIRRGLSRQRTLGAMTGLPWGLIAAFSAKGIIMALLSSLVGMRPKVKNPLWWDVYALWVAIVLLVGSVAPSWLPMSLQGCCTRARWRC